MSAVIKGQAGQPISFEMKPKVNGEDVALENQVIGVGQTWQNVTASRSVGVTYTNSTEKPITVLISVGSSAGIPIAEVRVDGLLIVSSNNTSQDRQTICFIVPKESTYRVDVTISPIIIWSELR